MFSLLLCIIYISFISLGLPDSLLSSGWPDMSVKLNTNISYAGIISMLISIGTIISSLFSDKMTKKFGPGKVTFFSVTLTAITMMAFSFCNKFWQLILLSIPYGLGAGGVDATLNNYVALHYSSKHMNWLHCFWGVGASISPFIMEFCLSKSWGWFWGYRLVAFIQIILCIFLFFSIPLWKNQIHNEEDTSHKSLSLLETLKIKGVIWILIMFFTYCALEQTSMLWASSFLVKTMNIDTQIAAKYGSLIFLGITVGRFVSGLVSQKINDKNLIKIGSIIISFSILLLFTNNLTISLIGLFFIGFGCAPIYPSIIHSTPIYFGKENSQSIIGIQMAFAYLGTTTMPMLFGLLTKSVSLSFYPICLILLTILFIITSNILNLIMNKDTKNKNQ